MVIIVSLLLLLLPYCCLPIDGRLINNIIAGK